MNRREWIRLAGLAVTGGACVPPAPVVVSNIGQKEEYANSAVSVGLQVGQSVVDFGLRPLLPTGELGERPVWLSDFVGRAPRQPAPALVLSFFGAWCSPCFERDFPALTRWLERFGAAGVQVLCVNVRLPDESVQAAVERTRARLGNAGLPPFPLLFDRTGRNARVYLGERVDLPATFVIDATGTIALRVHGANGAELDTVEALLAATVAS